MDNRPRQRGARLVQASLAYFNLGAAHSRLIGTVPHNSQSLVPPCKTNATMTIVSDEAAQLDLHCPQCGYNLRGIDSDVCPECGLAIDRVAFAQSQLPWSHRRRIG